MMRPRDGKPSLLRWIVRGALVILVVVAAVFSHFGGFGTGPSADPAELAAYAQEIEDITVPEGIRIVALGEATHGNVEFQQLKLEVFEVLVERYGVRAFALEGDCGGCEAVNRYIHGGPGTAEDAAASIGFTIYRTDEMVELIEWMHDYNETAAPGDDLRFYGFDMQQGAFTFAYLVEACQSLDVSTGALHALSDGEDWSEFFDWDGRIEVISKVRQDLIDAGATPEQIHLADVLLQHCAFYQAMETESSADSVLRRDAMMVENIHWIVEQEEARGHDTVFVSAHNGHVAKTSYESMGNLLVQDFGNAYYVIGTDFFHTTCNMHFMGHRFNCSFYSYDPLAKAAEQAGVGTCWLDLPQIPEDTQLGLTCRSYVYMGSLGEGYSPLMLVLPQSYRVYQCPTIWYDSLILVVDATPIDPYPVDRS